MRPLALLVLLAACDRDGNGNNNNNGDYPAVLNGAEETEQCGSLEISGCPFGAATTYFAGEYDFDGADVTGHEYWYWIPNDVLADQSDDWEPDTPCLLIFEFFGAKDDEPEDCNACLYQLTGDATFKADESDCATALETSSLTDASNWTGIVYNVREGDGGDVALYFESGTEVGSGPGNDSHLEWISAADCETVGATEEGCTPE